MPVWLVRAGAKGEHERKFLTDGRIYLTKTRLDTDISALTERDGLIAVMTELYGNDKPRKVSNLASQAWAFGHFIQCGDIVVMPSKLKQGIYLGKVCSDYRFNLDATDPYYHWREVNWLAEPMPRASFEQDLQKSFSAAMTICQVKRNNAEQRLQDMYNEVN